MNYILASKSPRRSEILQNLGIPFRVVTADTDENSSLTDPCALVEELSRRKGEAVRQKLLSEGEELLGTVIISSDTVVATAEGEILGKPKDTADAERMLRLLSGTTHQVISGIALLSLKKSSVSSEVTDVRFSPLSESDISLYIASDEPYDKAGAYAVQGMASLWIDGLGGDYFNVVGLPVKRLHDMLFEDFGIDVAPMVFQNTDRQV